jgi:putative hydrolase of the HAD superfamily
VQHTKIAGVIFDYGMVLARTLDPMPRALWERRLGLAPGALTQIVHNEQSWIAAQRGDITVAAHWQAIGSTLGLTSVETAALRAAFYRGDTLNVELVACLDTLRRAGLRLGLLSNFSTDLRTMLAQQDLLRRFDHIAISAEIGAMKPAAAAYTAILNMLALPAAACIFIDDQSVNVAAAQALGLHGIVFHDNASCLAELNSLLTAQPANPRGLPP